MRFGIVDSNEQRRCGDRSAAGRFLATTRLLRSKTQARTPTATTIAIPPERKSRRAVAALSVIEYRPLSDAFNGSAPLTAVNVRTGRVAWQAARLGEGHLRLADGKPMALDEDGTIALTRDTSQGFVVLSQVALLKKIA